jgi:hypothetical protein
MVKLKEWKMGLVKYLVVLTIMVALFCFIAEHSSIKNLVVTGIATILMQTFRIESEVKKLKEK